MTGTRSSHADAFPLMTGESACSFALRLANFLTVKPDGFLRSFVGDARNVALAVHLYDKVDFLSDASGLDRQAIAACFIRPSSDLAGERSLLDFTVAEHHIDQTTRRVSPIALASDVKALRPPYHRLIWSIRELRFDPETGSALISACDYCGRRLMWEDCVDPASCGRCGRPLWRAEASDEPMTQYDLLVGDLFHPDPLVRSERRSRLAPSLIGWSEGDLLDLMHTLRRVQRLFRVPSMELSAEVVGPEIIERNSSIADFLARPMKAAAQSSDSTAVTVAAAATTSALSAAPHPIANFLTSLMVSRA